MGRRLGLGSLVVLGLILAGLPAQADLKCVKVCDANCKEKCDTDVKSAPTNAKPSEKLATHAQQASIAIKGKSGGMLQSFAVLPSDDIVGLVGQGRFMVRASAGANQIESEVVILSPAGEERRRWQLPFKGNAINVTATGEIIVAGGGKIARFDDQGKELASIDAPWIVELLKDDEALTLRAEKQKATMIKNYETQLKVYEKQKATFQKQIDAANEKAKEADKDIEGPKQPTSKNPATARLETSLKNSQNMFDTYSRVVKDCKDKSIEQYKKELVERVSTVNSVAVGSDQLFVTSGEVEGYGFCVWKMPLAGGEGTKILSSLSGCCGQMDVQCMGDRLIVAENTKHQVGLYDLAGKRQAGFGKTDRSAVGGSFGGCCNPMNCRCLSDGDILTAESEGFVKRFSPSGEFLGVVGKAKLKGGCKNVSVAASKDGKRVYILDLMDSKIAVLAKADQPVVVQFEEEGVPVSATTSVLGTLSNILGSLFGN